LKEIPLSHGLVALVDDEDYEELSKHKWHLHKNTRSRTWYARRNVKAVNGKRSSILMHRQILGITDPDIQVDHRGGNGLDNQRENLRKALYIENKRNTPRYKSNASGYKGVWWHKHVQKWATKIQVSGKGIHLGYYNTPEDAHYAYCIAAKNHHGEFARTA
jgi:AP2 domain